MPTINNFQSQHGVLPANPGEAQVNPSQYGHDMEGLAQVGKQVEDLGARWLESKSKAEDADTVMKAQQARMEDFSKQSQAIKNSYLSVDPETGETLFDPRGAPEKDANGAVTYPNSYSQRIKQMANEGFAQDMEAMPSQRAANSYRTAMDGVVLHYMGNAQNDEEKGTTELFYRNRGRYVQQGAQTLYQNPSLQGFSDQVKALAGYDSANKGVMYDSERAAIEHDKSVRELINSGLLRGYLDKQGGPEQGLAILHGQVSGPAAKDQAAVMKYMNHDDLADWTEKFQSKIKANGVVEVHQLQNHLEDIKAAANNGDATVTLTQAGALIERQAALGAFKTPEDKVRAYSDVLSSMMVGKAKNSMDGMTNSEIVSSGDKFEGWYKSQVQRIANQEGVKLYHEFGAKDVADLRNRVEGTARDIMKERADNPAAAVMGSNSAVQRAANVSSGGMSPSAPLNENYFASSLREQARLGVQQPKPLTNEQAKSLAASLANSNGFDAAAQIHKVQVSTGKYFPQVLSQVIKDGHIPEYYAVAGYSDDLDAQRAIIDGMKNKGSFEKVLADKNLLFRKNEVEQKISKEFQPYWDSIVGEGSSAENVKIAEGLRQAALYDAANRVARGASASDAASQSVDTIIRDKNEVYKGAVIPRKIGASYNSESVKAQMDYVSTREFIDHNINNLYLPSVMDSVPSNGQVRDQSQYLKVQKEKSDRLYRALQDPNSHVWLTKPDGSGAELNLRVPSPHGPELYPLKTIDSKKPVQINWKDGRISFGD